MHKYLALLRAICATAALVSLFLAGPTASADDAEADSASAHVSAADIALERLEYQRAASEYRQAAELSSSVEIARKATRVATSYGFNEDALAAAERWIEIDPDSNEALFHVARLQLRLGKLRASRRSYKKLVENGDGPPEQVLLSLVGVLSDEDVESADNIMRSLARPYKDSATAHYAVAVTAMQADDLKHARERAKRAIELEPDWNKPKLLLGRIMLYEEKVDEAIDYVARIIGDAAQPDPEARMELALIMMAAGREDDALSQVNQIQYESGNNADAIRLMAIINFRQENLDAAWEDFQDLLASGRHTNDAMYYLARIADYRGETDRAMLLYSQVQSGSNAVAAQRRAAAIRAFEADDPETALEKLDEFATNNPLYAIDIVQSKAQLLAALERYTESLDFYDQLIRYRPDDEGVALGRAELLLRMDRLDDAIAQYRDTIDRWPDSALSLNALGYTLADRTEEYREAERLIRKALRIEPESAAIIDSMGWVLFKLGKYEEALVELQRAYERFSDPEVASHVIDVLAVLERHDEALELLEAAEAKSPDSPLLKDVRERVFPESE